MRFRQHQSAAQQASRRLIAWFALLVAGLVVAVNAALAAVVLLILPSHRLPALFFETNTAVILLFVLGGAWLERERLRSGGGPRVARWAGGLPLTGPRDPLERRLLNVVDEMALASGQPAPAVFLLHREEGINAFVAGWEPRDAALAVTQGALRRLTRDELQGLVAHEFGHIREGDMRLNMQLLAFVWGLSLVHGFGHMLMEPNEDGSRNPLTTAVGAVVVLLGWLGWFAGRLLQAAVSRQREYLADASAVQFTRSRDGLGNTLRKIWHLSDAGRSHPQNRLHHPHSDVLAAMLLDDPQRRRWLATHPPLEERIRRISGRGATPLPAPELDAAEAAGEPRHRPLAALAPDSLPNAQASAFAGFAPGSFTVQDPARAPAGRALPTSPSVPPSSAPPTAEEQEERDILARWSRLHGPQESRLAVLALLLPWGPLTPAEAEACWLQAATGAMQGPHLLADARTLPAERRLPVLEALLDRIARRPAAERRALLLMARQALQPQVPATPARLRLLYLAVWQRLHPRQTPWQGSTGAPVVPAAAAPLFDQLLDAQHTSPTLPALARAVRHVRRQPWQQRPAWIKTWSTTAHASEARLDRHEADTLRVLAQLVDVPLPPGVASWFREWPAEGHGTGNA